MGAAGRSLRGLNLLGGLHAVSVAILLLSDSVAQVSHSASASGVSSLGLHGPVISSLLGVEAATRLGILSLLLVEVGSSGESTDAMGVHVLLTSCWSSSLDKHNTIMVSHGMAMGRASCSKQFNRTYHF